jgi:transposase
MFLLSPQTKVYLAKQVTDMRKSFRGLITLTESILQQDPVSGHLFVFVNRRRDLLKILHWDGSGFWIWYRQLERGTFQLPTPPADHEQASIELTPAQLSLILDGIDLKSVRQRLRYRHADLATSNSQQSFQTNRCTPA